jgi:hypothetical protein
MARACHTAVAEVLATSVGAGVVLGGFLAGVFGTVLGWKTAEREQAAVAIGSLMGLAMAVLLTVETIIR